MPAPPSRNGPCPCGSGKKYKHCCLVGRPSNHSDKDWGTLVNEAIAHYEQGDQATSEANCWAALALNPRAHQALNLLSIIALDKQDFAAAELLIGQAIELNGDVAQYHNTRGNTLQDLERYREALVCFETAIRLRPDMAEPYQNRGNALQQLGRHEMAISCHEMALQLRPDNADAHNSLGNALSVLKRHEDAALHYEQAVALRPGYAEAHGNLGSAYKVLGRYEEAVAACLEAIRVNPRLPEPFCILGDTYSILMLTDDAIVAYNEAIRVSPTFARALNNLGNVYLATGHFIEAGVLYSRAIAAEPERAEQHANIGSVYRALNREEDALAAYKQAITLNPTFLPGIEGLFTVSRILCEWDNIENTHDRYRSIIHGLFAWTDRMFTSPFNTLTIPLAPLDQRTLVQKVSTSIAAPYIPMRSSLPTVPTRLPTQRLRIGYLSSDYRSHATAHLLGHLFQRHDRTRFEVIAYSTSVNDGSEYRQRFEREAERFVDMHGWTQMHIAHQIRVDGVDILVDLHGHTVGSNLAALALHPARIQVHFLGYPGTVGKDLVDYSLIDAVVCPPEHDHYYSEKTYRLPDTYQLNEHETPAPRQPRENYGLPERCFVFCCFNASYKLSPEIFKIWLRILARAPDSVLWLYGTSESVIRNITAWAGKMGCSSERLIFGPPLAKAQHLARLQHADLMLDTPVVNAMTTASDALWAGVPVLSTLGASFPDRAGASLLTAIGLPELIMPDLETYEATAIHLAQHPEEIAALKAKLAANRLTYPLFDTARFVRNLETAYEEIWERHILEINAAESTSIVYSA